MRFRAAVSVAIFLSVKLSVIGAPFGFEVPDPGRGFARDRIVEGIECVGALGGVVTTHDRYNQYLFLAQGCVLHVWDCSDPKQPREVSWVKFPSYVNTISVRFPAVYVATSYKSVHILDVTDLSRPKYQNDLEGGGSLDLSAKANGNLLSVGEYGKYGESFYVYDVSKPLTPILLRDGSLRRVFAYATNGSKFFQLREDSQEERLNLTVFDIGDSKTSITTLGTFSFPETEEALQFKIRNEGLILFSQQNSQTIQLLSPEESNLVLIDGEFYGQKPSEVFENLVSEETLQRILNEQSKLQFDKIKVWDDKAYLVGSNGYFTILDIHEPTSPTLLAQYRTDADVVSFATNGVFLYYCDNARTLTSLSISSSTMLSPRSMTVVSSVASEMVIQDNVLLLATDEGLSAYDVGLPASPKQLGHFKTPKRCSDVVTSGTEAIIISDGDVSIIDFSAPANLRMIRTISVFGNDPYREADWDDYRLKRLDNHLYVIRMTRGMHVSCNLAVLDLNQRDLPIQIIEPPMETWDEIPTSELQSTSNNDWVLGLPISYSQTSGGQSGMYFYGFSKLDAPRLIGEYWRLSRVLDHSPLLFKENLYVPDGENGLLVLRRRSTPKPD